LAENVCAGHSGIVVRVDTLEKRADGHDTRLDEGEKRMDEIEKDAVEQKSDLKATCARLDRLIYTMWAFMGLAVAAIPLIIWILERGR